MILFLFHVLSIIFIVLGFTICIGIAWDETRHPQHMWIMNAVWPVTALFGTFVALWAYVRYGRLATHEAMSTGKRDDEKTPFSVMVGKAASHCGAGCTLGDIAAEWLAFSFPIIVVWFGYGTLFPDKIFAVWAIDFVFAFAIGIVFQYFTIKPMRSLSVKRGIVQAVKADTLSLIAWQIGMYGFMGIAQFIIFQTLARLAY